MLDAVPPPTRAAPAAVSVPLPVRAPFDAAGLLAFLAHRAIPGVEDVSGTTYRRTLPLQHGPAVVTLTLGGERVDADLVLSDPADRDDAVRRCVRLLDLDADPTAVDATLAADPVLRPLVATCPGRRAPGAADPVEMAVRAVLGQQISVAGARTLAARLVVALGEPLPWSDSTLTHTFPSAAAVASAPDAVLAMPASRQRTLRGLGAALADGRVVLDPDGDHNATERRLLALPGVGPWTASYLRMRALSDPDVFLPTDLGVRKALAALGVPPGSEKSWRPYRSYAVGHLWASLSG